MPLNFYIKKADMPLLILAIISKIYSEYEVVWVNPRKWGELLMRFYEDLTRLSAGRMAPRSYYIPEGTAEISQI